MAAPLNTAALLALVAEARAEFAAHPYRNANIDVPALCDAVEMLVREVGRLAEAREVDAQIDGRTMATLAAEAREARAERDRYRWLLARVVYRDMDEQQRDATFPNATWADIEKIAKGGA